MKALYRKLLIAISTTLVIICSYTPTNSCGPEYDPDEMRIMLFRSYLSGLDNMQAFYYTPAFTTAWDTDPLKTDNRRNCHEWQVFTGKEVSAKDIYEVQYAMHPDDFLYTIRHPAATEKNTFIKWLLQPAHKTALDYLSFAKRIEFAQTIDADPWKTDETGYTSRYYDSLSNEAMQQCETIHAPFLQERYAFQAMKLLSYTIFTGEKDPIPHFAERTRACYEKYLLHKKSIVADWALIYYAAVQKDENDRLLTMLQAFDRSEEKKAYAQKYLSSKKLTALKKTVPDHATRTLISAVAAMQNPGRALPTIQEISVADPSNKYLPLLICREVNKLEDWLLSPELLKFGPGSTGWTEKIYDQKNQRKDRIYLRQVRDQFIAMLPRATTHKDLLSLAIVHLFQVDHQYAEANKYLRTIHTTNPRYLKQQAIATTLNLIYTSDVSSPAVQQTLYKQLATIIDAGEEDYNYQEYEGSSRPSKTISQLYLALSWQMKAKGDIVKAGLLSQKAGLIVNDYYGYRSDTDTISYNKIAFFDKYASPENIDALLAFKHGKHKTPFEKQITPKIWATDDFYLDLKGTLQLRQKRYKAALATFERIPDHFWVHNYQYNDYLTNRYIGNTVGLTGILKTSEKKYPYVSKKLILRDIVGLLDTLAAAKQPAEKARLSLLAGNALFNISRPGKAWMMFSYGKGAGEGTLEYDDWYRWVYYTFSPNDKMYESSYYRCADAVQLYHQALANAGNDKETAAQATVMLAVCDKAVHDYFPYKEGYSSPYERLFKARYNKTQSFTAAVSSCPDIRSWGN